MRIIYNIELYFSWLECHPDKMKVVGSSPISSTIFIEVWPNWLRFLFWEQEIVGSSPVTSTIFTSMAKQVDALDSKSSL